METLKPRVGVNTHKGNGIPFGGMFRAFLTIRRALLAALSHDVLGTAKAAAYSAILSLFPAILVFTALLALAPEAESVRGDLLSSFTEILPTDTMTLLHASFSNRTARSEQVVFSASLISLWAAMGVMLSLMEGFRRAYNLPRGEWPFWLERIVAFALIPSCLAPMAFATVMVAFGHQFELWVISNTDHVLKSYVLLLWRIIRLAIGLVTTICVLAVIYHFGTPRRQGLKHVIAGASGAASMWFLVTVTYGFYITRFANYSLFYGSLGTVVATLVWLYITSLSVLMGAEFNAQFRPKPSALDSPDSLSEAVQAKSG
jgi:membrane protein